MCLFGFAEKNLLYDLEAFVRVTQIVQPSNLKVNKMSLMSIDVTVKKFPFFSTCHTQFYTLCWCERTLKRQGDGEGISFYEKVFYDQGKPTEDNKMSLNWIYYMTQRIFKNKWPSIFSCSHFKLTKIEREQKGGKDFKEFYNVDCVGKDQERMRDLNHQGSLT